MTEREKVIEALEACVLKDPDDSRDCRHCPRCNYGAFITTSCINGVMADALALLKAQEPRVHGRWEETDDGWNEWYYRCSACGCEWFLEDGTPAENGMNYCPRCGAKMDGLMS